MKNTPNAERLLMDLAYYNQVSPSKDQKVNRFYAKIREDYFLNKGYVLKYGKCEICGEEGVLCEVGLNWVCNWNDKCQKEMDEWYVNEIKEWRKKHSE